MMISEWIQILLKPMGSTSKEQKNYVSQMIDQAEVILKHLPDADRDTLNRYLEHLMEQMQRKNPVYTWAALKMASGS